MGWLCGDKGARFLWQDPLAALVSVGQADALCGKVEGVGHGMGGAPACRRERVF